MKRLSPLPVVKMDNEDDPRIALTSLADRRHYAGFFQSADYFANVESEVRAAFAPRAEHVEAFSRRYTQLASSPYVCCHVRRTDYELLGWDLPISYYRECLQLAREHDDMNVVFIGDDLDVVEREFGAEPGIRFERNGEAVDLLLLVNADVAVTSNSSFGWWGSWLGSPGRPVYAPMHWLGFKQRCEIPCRVLPPEWRQIAVAVDR
jgi:hypothetical protein